MAQKDVVNKIPIYKLKTTNEVMEYREELKKHKCWNVKEFFKSNYIKSKDVNAWLCLAEITK